MIRLASGHRPRRVTDDASRPIGVVRRAAGLITLTNQAARPVSVTAEAARPVCVTRGAALQVCSSRAPVRALAACAALGVLASMAGCGRPPTLVLPSGPGAPAADAAAVAAEVFRGCGDVRTMTAEIGLSGRAGRQKLRARLIAGFADPASVRLEAAAPFGPPAFILAARPDEATLLLPRDDRVLTGVEPSRMLEALSGLELAPDDLRMLLAGCPSQAPGGDRGIRYGTAWLVLDEGAAGSAYLRAAEDGWQLAAVRRSSLVVEYSQTAGRRPGAVRFRDPSATPRFDLTLRLSQVELNVEVPPEAFTVKVPADAVPITLDELRDAGPMRETRNAERGARNP